MLTAALMSWFWDHYADPADRRHPKASPLRAPDLSKLPLDSLKIDRIFIHGMTERADDTSIVSAIISLAHALRLKVVAEGVETEQQAELLRLLRCDQAQGYLFSPPVPAERIEVQLKAI